MLKGLATLILGAVFSATAAQSGLTLTATIAQVANEGGHKYVLYRGVLHNDGPEPVGLDLAQMPGGFAGKSTLFLCSVEKWNASQREWKVAFKNYPDQTNQKTALSPGRGLEVCVVPLPNLGVRDGDRVRFALRLLKGNAKADAVSNAFIVGKDTQTSK